MVMALTPPKKWPNQKRTRGMSRLPQRELSFEWEGLCRPLFLSFFYGPKESVGNISM